MTKGELFPFAISDSFGEVFKKALKYKGLKQVDIARNLGYSRTQISLWANGTTPNEQSLAKIHGALGDIFLNRDSLTAKWYAYQVPEPAAASEYTYIRNFPDEPALSFRSTSLYKNSQGDDLVRSMGWVNSHSDRVTGLLNLKDTYQLMHKNLLFNTVEWVNNRPVQTIKMNKEYRLMIIKAQEMANELIDIERQLVSDKKWYKLATESESNTKQNVLRTNEDFTSSE